MNHVLGKLEQQVQHLGRLRQQRQQLESQEEQLAQAVRSQMSEHGLNATRSDDFEAKLIKQQRLTVKAAAFQRAVTKKEFLSAVTVSVTAARKIIGDIKLRKISEAVETVQLRLVARDPKLVIPRQDEAKHESAA